MSGAAEQALPDVPLTLIRPALELAWAVARLGAEARPPIAVPGRLRPLLRAAKLPDRMLLTIRQVLDDDAEFRRRVAELAEETVLGRPAWLWLVRPDGWNEELQELAGAAEAAASDAEQERRVRSVQRQLDSAQTELARLRAEVAVLREANAGLGRDAEDERRARRKSESERDRIQSALQTANVEQARLQQALSELTAEVSLRSGEAVGASERSAALSDELALAQAEARQLEDRFASARRDAEEAATGNRELRAGVAAALSRAAAAAAELGGALGAAAESLALSVPAPDAGLPEAVGEPEPLAPAAPSPGRGKRGGRPPSRRRRIPLPLPPAIFDDTVDAAAHLVRVAGVTLIVDGYNITLTSWPALDLPAQRRRLLDALAELTARTGAAIRVVFDGTDEGGVIKPSPSASRRMQIRFTAGDVEADQVIVEMVEQLGEHQPVVVASDDRWVRDETAARGANLISVGQLLAVLGRAPSGR